jgi:uncharacterized membrane protein (TIGR02234 family)
MTRYRELTAALLAIVIGAAGALLLAGGTWQTITATRPRPAADLVIHVTGRTLEPAVTALAIVALAGIVAVLATRGLAKRLVGVLIAVAGAGIVWRAALALPAVSATHARALLKDQLTGASLTPGIAPGVVAHRVGPLLVLIGGLLILAGGVLVAGRAQRLSGLSGRYEAPTQAAQADRARGPKSDLAVWTALDRGDDPTLVQADDGAPAADLQIRTES